MPLNAVRYLVPGLVAGLVAFVFSRLMIAPLIAAAIEYEARASTPRNTSAAAIRTAMSCSPARCRRTSAPQQES